MTTILAKRATSKTRIKPHVVYIATEDLRVPHREGMSVHRYETRPMSGQRDRNYTAWYKECSNCIYNGDFFAVVAENFKIDASPEAPKATPAETRKHQDLVIKARGKLTASEREALGIK